MRVVSAAVPILLLLASAAHSQDFSYRGFAQARATLYPQSAPATGDDTRAVAEALVRFEPAYRPAPWLRIAASFDARTDTAEQVEREWRVDWRDRGTTRPAFSIRQLAATLRRGGATADVGKQFIRWGKADILNPTDRFAPRDFLEVTDNDFLAVTGGRLQYEAGPNTIDVVWVPWFTPSRIPLFNRRWTVLPEGVAGLPVVDLGSRFPSGSQIGGRWNHLGTGYEFSVSLYDGFNHLPSIEANVQPFPPALDLTRTYPSLRMAGADAAVPFSWFTLKGEAAYLKASDGTADDVVLYVIEAERQSGELSLVGGYAGEVVTASRAALSFAPDRGLTRSFLGRASYTIDANRSVAVEAAVRQDGAGVWIKAEYSQASGQHWRVTAGATAIRGRADDFFGQYRRNSHGLATLRYSF